MKHIDIIGIGLSADTITQEGLCAVENADSLFGAPRMLEAFSCLEKTTYSEYEPAIIAKIISQSKHLRFAVLVSGDTGFYSAAEKLSKSLSEYETVLIPGVSSLSYFFARLKRPWQNARLVSCHGRNTNLVDAVRRSRLTFALTGGNICELTERLAEAGFGSLQAHAGENLGLPGERIVTSAVSEICSMDISTLSVLLIENPGFDERIRSGIPDVEFIRSSVPMTKSEVRAVTLSKLSVKPDDICCDIGAGTGSVTVEMAMAAYTGHVYAIDKNPESSKLVTENCLAFHIGNATFIPGSAPAALSGLPKLNAAFVGGSGGNMRSIIAALLDNNPKIRIVINAVSLENAAEAAAALTNSGFVPDIVQISAARSQTVGVLNMMTAQNPVFIISGGCV